jgi:hypothetical protein
VPRLINLHHTHCAIRQVRAAEWGQHNLAGYKYARPAVLPGWCSASSAEQRFARAMNCDTFPSQVANLFNKRKTFISSIRCAVNSRTQTRKLSCRHTHPDFTGHRFWLDRLSKKNQKKINQKKFFF